MGYLFFFTVYSMVALLLQYYIDIVLIKMRELFYVYFKRNSVKGWHRMNMIQKFYYLGVTS